ncbi:MAG TPA: hypothetical protein VG734_04405 [Lacunisphaera sp.]|nr:hypothetical protein [Lacunisphaera sp.]
MKQDPYFKYLVAIILAGMVVAVFNASPAPSSQPTKVPAAVTTASHSHKAKG